MKKLFGIVTLLTLILPAWSQRIQIQNLAGFDERKFHFGFALGYNTSNFDYEINHSYLNSTDSLLGVSITRQPGFNLGIISSLNITQNLKLRFVPSLSFQDRVANYTYQYRTLDSTKVLTQDVRSTFLNFPLLFKFRTNRVNNFAAYALFGGYFGLDMASQKDVKDDEILKIQQADYGFQVGGGVDFFLQYFKLGFELKLSNGIPNILIQENNSASAPFNNLKSRSWMFSITFEG